jgi:outer membrane protein OmpA-like peptidoglycan-associated protein
MNFRIYKILFLLFGLSVTLSSCSGGLSPKENNKEVLPFKDSVKTEISRANWRNPVMSQMGVPISRVIRAYYLVGDYKKMLQFVIVPPCYERKQIEYIIRKSNWGYEINLTNLQWLQDSTFILTHRTSKQNTTAAEQYIGRIVNDTAKIFLFPEKQNLFQYYGDENIDDPCQLKDALDQIYFAFDKTTILKKSNTALRTILNYLKSNTNIRARFIGHTSNEGSKSHNMQLSELRAKAICDYLSVNGLSPERLSYVGKGDTEPLVLNDTESNKSKNRRVEISITDYN